MMALLHSRYWPGKLPGFLFLLTLLTTSHRLLAEPQLILIIDDIGYNRALGQQTLELPGPLNLAFLPHTPFSRSLAEQAHQSGHTVMLHAPMANKAQAKLGPGGLTEEMSPEQWRATLLDNIQAIPYVEGINNHMGSQLTENSEAMSVVMQVLQQQGLFFVDSLTTAHSVAQREALKAGLPSLKRDIFLDHVAEEDAIQQQLDKAIKRAQKRGISVAIGHPYPETLSVLKRELPNLSQHNVSLVGASQYLKQHLWQDNIWNDNFWYGNQSDHFTPSKYQLQPFHRPAFEARTTH